MNKKIGRVIEVFIPKEQRNEQNLDVMDCKKIGFKILVDNKLIEVIEDQNEINCDILKDDMILIIESVISNKKIIDIEKYAGDIYE